MMALRIMFLLALWWLTSAFSGFSRATALSTLNHWFRGKDEPVAKPAKQWLKLLTVVPTSSSTGATVTEATGAEGYAPKEIPFADMEGTEGETAVVQNAVEELFAAITGGTATVVAWCITDKGGPKEGNITAWGTATSTVISATQTPPMIKAKGLRIELS
jgi:hypothetical protein